MKGIKTGTGVSEYRRIGDKPRSSFRKSRQWRDYPESIVSSCTSGKGSLSQGRRIRREGLKQRVDVIPL